MKNLYKVLNKIRRIYWFIFRPTTKGVKCLVRNEGKYLLIKTSYSGDYWTMPGGGCRFREDPIDAAWREVREELGVNLVYIKFLGSYESTIEYKKDKIFLFVGDTEETLFKLQKSEVSDAQWFSVDSIPENRSRALKETLPLI